MGQVGLVVAERPEVIGVFCLFIFLYIFFVLLRKIIIFVF